MLENASHIVGFLSLDALLVSNRDETCRKSVSGWVPFFIKPLENKGDLASFGRFCFAGWRFGPAFLIFRLISRANFPKQRGFARVQTAII